jgi:hypothetical protein
VEVSWEGLRRTPSGYAAAGLTISEGGAAVKYSVYLRNDIRLNFESADRGRVELAARLLRLAGVDAKVRKMGGSVWHVRAYTDMLAAGREELRNALTEIVRKAVESDWVDERKAERWLDKLERGRVLREGWPKYEVRLVRSGALELRFGITNPNNVMREVQWLRDMGLVEGKHFAVKMPDGRNGYVKVLREDLAYAAWLSAYGEGKRQRLTAEFIGYILERAEKEGEEIYEKAKEIVEEGRTRGSLTLKGFEKKVEVGGRRHAVKVIGGGPSLRRADAARSC